MYFISTRFVSSSIVYLTDIWFLFWIYVGFPQYSSSDYDEEYDTDYGNEEYDTKEANVDAKDLSEYNPQMSTKSKTIEVDAGTTIRLNCDIENLNRKLKVNPMLFRLITESKCIIDVGEQSNLL